MSISLNDWLIHQQQLINKTIILRGIITHSYCDYNGPWIENKYFQYFNNDISSHYNNKSIFYLPIFWTDIWCLINNIHTHDNDLEPITVQYFKIVLENVYNFLNPNYQYYTIIQHDHGYSTLQIDDLFIPKNVYIYTCTGRGDCVIPLLKDDTICENVPIKDRKYLISFVGQIAKNTETVNDIYTPIRKYMHQYCKEKFDEEYIHYYGTEWKNYMQNSIFSLCPRGNANTSFRFYESLLCNSIPIYIYTDEPVLPYRDIVPWDDISIIVDINDIDKIPQLVEKFMTRINDIEEQIKKIIHMFTYSYICERISNHSKTLQN